MDQPVQRLLTATGKAKKKIKNNNNNNTCK